MMPELGGPRKRIRRGLEMFISWLLLEDMLRWEEGGVLLRGDEMNVICMLMVLEKENCFAWSIRCILA